jgi:hypothetical protein
MDAQNAQSGRPAWRSALSRSPHVTAGRRAVITSSGRCWLRSGPRPQSCGQLAGLYFYTSPPTSRTYYSAADRVSGPPCAGTSVRRCMPQGFVILTAKPVRRSRRKGPAAGTWPGRSRCRRRPGPGSGPETGAGPGLSACPAPGRRPCPRTPRQSPPPRPRPPRRSSKRLPDTPVSMPGIMLSDEGGQGERARSRRSARSGGRLLGRLAAAENGCSGAWTL